MKCSNTSQGCWQTVSSEYLHWARWESETVVFNELTAETHLLNDLTLAILLILSESPLSCSMLLSQLYLEYQLDQDTLTDLQLSHLLNELDELGLIESVSV
ncbi:HPr-rel-A system PqqD family peptide chaperone [Zooshikella marina]|uniref:HPr-rel-A system PqqD family peptide chaperone n=1 Tax=Zooshikella ganghwensis TaxID=202772 RepID=UPI000487AF3B|nr:HPr-rel-A system PqqD family peptide chaperone [Zooshikella ganghwensis]MBU2708165.1 HPr-rel-A system PqqD family peptide chaperone [Zooshikella ganghwensis]